MRELDYPFDSEWILKKKRKIKKELLAEITKSYIEKRIAILGGSTTSDIKDILELFLLNDGIKPTFYESEYNKYYEDGMFDNPALVEFDPEIIYIHTSNRNIYDWPEVTDNNEQINQKLENEISKFTSLWNHLFAKYHCSIIQNNFEMPFYRLLGNQDACLLQGKLNFVNRLNEKIYEYARSHENFYIHDINYEAASYGLEKWADPSFWHLYKYAMCVPAIPYTAHGVYKIIKSLLGKNKKVLALDLDNTLWGGVIGDDGPENIEIGQETAIGQTYSEFQRYIKEQKNIGALLTIISKNDDEVAKKGLARPDSILKEEDFASFKANWEPKGKNLVDEANELSLLPESFVLIDDNPAERENVSQTISGVQTPDIGQVEQYIQRIDQAGYFEVTKLSADDTKRNEMYVANAKRIQAQTSYSDYGEYLKSLEMVAEIEPFNDMYMSRIAQLTNKSNQFNLTTKRYTQAEIQEITEDDSYITLYGKLEDKFGDNGVVSVVIGKELENTLHIDLWLMSCRVLKRDLEYAMMDKLISICSKKGIKKIIGYYYPTAKNSMVKEFYSLFGFENTDEDAEGNTTWVKQIPEECEKMNKYIEVKEVK